MAIFQYFNLVVVRYRGFLKVQNFNCGYGSKGQDASSYQIMLLVKPLLRYGYFSIFQNGSISAILDLSFVCSDHPRKVFAGLCHFAKFGWIRCSSFMLENAYTRPKNRSFGDFTLNVGVVSTRPKKALSGSQMHHVTYTSLKSVRGCGLGAINSDSPCFSMGQKTPKIVRLLRGSEPHLIHGSSGPLESAHKRHLYRVGRFAGFTNVTNRQTHGQSERQTDRPRYTM